MPKMNGESNEKPVGSILFEKGENSQDRIAVKVNGKYISASKLEPLDALPQKHHINWETGVLE
jgi:hypothetical protein